MWPARSFEKLKKITKQPYPGLTWQHLIFGSMPIVPDDSSHPFRHGFHQIFASWWRNAVPSILYMLPQFLFSSRTCRWKLSFNNLPQVLDRIQVRRLCRPIHDVNFLINKLFITAFAVCFGSLSCMNCHFNGISHSAWGNMTVWMMFKYRCWSMIAFIQKIGPTPYLEKHPQTMMLPPCKHTYTHRHIHLPPLLVFFARWSSRISLTRSRKTHTATQACTHILTQTRDKIRNEAPRLEFYAFDHILGDARCHKWMKAGKETKKSISHHQHHLTLTLLHRLMILTFLISLKQTAMEPNSPHTYPSM